VNPVLKKIYKKIAEDTGVSLETVEAVIRSQFQFVRDTMASAQKNDPSSFKVINVTHLGKFAVREFKVEEYYKKSLENDNRSKSSE
jgi:CRISPR/Cas system type I-B associated protein Csh2 (Cas7 group RAMP superfamily)